MTVCNDPKAFTHMLDFEYWNGFKTSDRRKFSQLSIEDTRNARLQDVLLSLGQELLTPLTKTSHNLHHLCRCEVAEHFQSRTHLIEEEAFASEGHYHLIYLHASIAALGLSTLRS